MEDSKMKRIIALLLLLAMLAPCTAIAETGWAQGGFKSGETDCAVMFNSDDSLFKGSYGSTDVLVRINFCGALEDIPYFYIALNIKDKDNTYTWKNSTGSDATFDIEITDEAGEKHSFFGHQRNENSELQIFNSEEAFNTIVQYGDRSRENCGDALALLLTDQELDFVVSNRDGSWSVRFTADMSGFNNAYDQVFGDYLWDREIAVVESKAEENYNPDEVEIEAAPSASWGHGVNNDEFGDPIEGSGFVMNTKHFEGVFSNSATYNSPLWTDMMLDQYGLSFWFYEYQRQNNLYRNNYYRYDRTYSVRIKDESGEVHDFFGFMLVGDAYLRVVESKKVYNRINHIDDIRESDYDEILALFMKDQVLKVSITADEGADSFSFQINTNGFVDAYGKTISPLKEYSDKETVKKAQTALNEAGYDCGKPDGIAGKGTKAAVTAYQTDKGLTANGAITHELLVSLGLIG